MQPSAPKESSPFSVDIVDVRLEQANSEDWSAQAGPEWGDAEALYTHLAENTNHVKAAKRVPWTEVIPEGATVLDLGCGSGWLTGMLTRNERVAKVIAWDLSPSLLGGVLPAMVALTGGDLSKVKPICGHFTPLLLDDHSIDVVVMGSAFHHATHSEVLLQELVRVVDPAGTIALLNEVPWSRITFVLRVGSILAPAVVNGLSNRLTIKKGGHVAADHVLYDDVLGDRALTLAQWHRLFRNHDLDVEMLDTALPPYPRHYRRRQYLTESNLTHFLLRPKRG
jgi:SAM-dependent methyltransferase